MHSKNSMIIRFRSWEFEVDKQATERVYQAVDKGGARRCGCNHCQNFLLQQASVYPSEVIDFVKDVGIDQHKEVEVVEYGALNNGLPMLRLLVPLRR